MRLSSVNGALAMELEAVRPHAVCPGCGGVSRQLHSWYWRRLEDLPWAGRAMMVRLRSRTAAGLGAWIESARHSPLNRFAR
ncbi:MAG TPA: transposase family protein, partial [Chloroflexota bacterium]|nr:transposase family protein [Chloroflexota bacterium]